MERFCGSLLPAIKSRKHPFSSLNHRVRDVAQLSQLKLIYSLTEELDLSERREDESAGTQYGGYPGYIMLSPRERSVQLDTVTRTRIASYIEISYGLSKSAALKCVPAAIEQWGRFRQPDGGDTIRGRDVVRQSEGSATRNASAIKFTALVKSTTKRARNRKPIFEAGVFYGEVSRFFALPITTSFSAAASPSPPPGATHLLLALVSPFKLESQNRLGMPFYRDTPSSMLAPKVIDISTIECLVGRVKDRGQWAVVDRHSGIVGNVEVIRHNEHEDS
ncbi:hypothetical protein BOTBODRAFT_34816 [Botryobasidium botryosum FD-172 SS1]|uniref:Uncharacterized protein n=1 Tax=Botryobasidium botryosum (strain FD-172 SS1) TaxID=930990 RepID=A0A067MK13_BOTB1|nr:hypothetical protein BOTBODRAFT_34816 [Botryobasidium botryosum FD-172 SS1]